MKIKTLAEILAESDSDSASSSAPKEKSYERQKTFIADNNSDKLSTDSRVEYPNSKRYSSSDADNINDFTTFDSTTSTHSSSKTPKTKTKKRQKRFHPAANFIAESNDAPIYKVPAPQSIQEMLAEVKREIHGEDNDSDVTDNAINIEAHSEYDMANEEADNLPSALKAYLRTPEQRQAETDAIKAESRLRWLAFYYLSRREYGKAELKQKLLDKEQGPEKIDALLEEFEEKGYQSDYRTTLMLIRESIRKGRGHGHIKQEFYRKKVAMPDNIDELIDMANAESDEFREFVDDSKDSLVEGVDWLKLAVTARIKKYGDNIPTEQKDKAKQLRFLQYRGFNMDICFQALNYTLDNLDERF
ncbi:regulatory protein RecX [Psychrobacter frigidicola]|uniref:Regulatory protein RecX n=1 Tax=Psychrobacter frigidicola TaxID=45611 RepID=A0A5C7A0V6_9GAMM|nr:regulatory protein RecX [Psychrobacter frigidicola]TXD96472.1 regulatory protein RecX [Psychrobacter frigidicola]